MSFLSFFSRSHVWFTTLAILSTTPSPSISESNQQVAEVTRHAIAVGGLTVMLPTTLEFSIYRQDRNAPIGRKVLSGESPIVERLRLDSLAIPLNQLVPEATHGGLVYIATNDHALVADTYCNYVARTRSDKSAPFPVEDDIVRLPINQSDELYVLGAVSFLRRPVVLLSNARHFIDVFGRDFGQHYTLLAAVRSDVLLSLQFYEIDIPKRNWPSNLSLLSDKLSAWMINAASTFTPNASGVTSLECSP